MPLILNYLLQNVNVNKNKCFYTSKILKDYYDVLNLSRNCTTKEIKESFIELSKKYHPDLSKMEDAHKKFLEINRAYEVLGNTKSRRQYDLGLMPQNYPNNTSGPQAFYRGAWKDPSFYANRDRSTDSYYRSRPYYGIKGINRVSNATVLVVLMFFTTIVIGLQILAIRYSFTFRRNEIIRRSNEANDALRNLQEMVGENGNKVQLELLQAKFRERHKSD